MSEENPEQPVTDPGAEPASEPNETGAQPETTPGDGQQPNADQADNVETAAVENVTGDPEAAKPVWDVATHGEPTDMQAKVYEVIDSRDGVSA